MMQGWWWRGGYCARKRCKNWRLGRKMKEKTMQEWGQGFISKNDPLIQFFFHRFSVK